MYVSMFCRSTILKYSDETMKLAQRLLGCISESLGEETSYVQESLGEPSQNIVMNYYCPCPQPELALALRWVRINKYSLFPNLDFIEESVCCSVNNILIL